jgi:Ca2+-transporting ATPase
VKEGRGIFRNIRKAVHFLLSSNIGEIITIFVSILFGWRAPLLAIHLLWVNLVTDSLPAIALGMDKTEQDIMKRKSGANHKSLFSDGLWQRIALEGCMIGMLALLAFGVGVTFFDRGDAVEIGRTMAFATLSMTQLVHAFNMRTEKSIFSIDLFDNIYLVGALIIGVLLQVSVITIAPVAEIFKVVPLDPACWLIVLLLCLLPVALVELEKYLSRLGLRKQLMYAASLMMRR